MTGTGHSPPDEPWYEAQRERLAWELEQFAAHGLPATQRTGRRDGGYPDLLVIETELSFVGDPVLVEVVFPHEYPDQPPSPFGPVGLLARHQGPDDGLFCWSDDPDGEWSPSMAAVSVLDIVQTLLIDTGTGPAAVTAGEADMPEPVTGFVIAPGGVVIVPDPFFERDLPASEGVLSLMREDDRLLMVEAVGLNSVDAALVRRFMPKGKREPAGYWVELSPMPPADAFNDNRLVDVVHAASAEVFGRLQRRLQKKRASVAEGWLGMTFLEEGPVRGEVRRNWVFARISLDQSGAGLLSSKRRAQALNLSERQRRTPELVGLGEARVLLVGAGSLGSPAAFELAKAGVGQLDIVDADIFDVNNSVRHALPPRYAGQDKAEATADCAAELNPFVTVEPHVFRVGFSTGEAARLTELLAQATVVVDTTGSASVARILQRYAERAGKPLVVAGLSAGSYGGDIFICSPGEACLECFLLSQRDKTIPEPDAAPPTSLVTPVGCSHPAFAGAGFDATAFAALVARTTVQATAACAYPAAGFNWAVTNFRSPPRWRRGTLDRRSDCSRHP